MKTLLIMAGGTGGHVIPALAVANNLRDRGVNIIWMGTKHGIEFDLVPKAGFDLKLVNVKGVRGSGIARLLLAPFTIAISVMQALSIIFTSKANAILGMGGFVSGPGGLAGRLLLKPLVLHEQNAIAGTTNKLLAPIASRVLTGFGKVSALPKGQYLGNPVKPEIVAIDPPAQRISTSSAQFNILVIGGSQGALVFNQKLPALLSQLQNKLGQGFELNVHHQCGKNKAHAVMEEYERCAQAAKVYEFIDDMATAYAWSDIVICRSGAMTVSEVSAAGAVALFVPFPHAIDDHQFFNAQVISQSGASICVRQNEFIEGKWIDQIAGLALDRVSLIKMAEKCRTFAKPNATKDTADICMEVMNA